jgi:HEAT repeat protein
MSIRETIADIADSANPLRSSMLIELSDLNSAELAWLEQAWTAINPKRRRQIVYRLVELAEDNFELDFDSVFKCCLKDRDAAVRCKAIEGLWESEEPSLINYLADMLEHDSSEKVRAAAAAALGKFAMLAEHEKLRSCHKSRIFQTLLAVVDDESQNVEIRRRALEAVSALNFPQVHKAIKDGYQSDNPELRVSAIYAMGRNCDSSWYEAAVACGELGEEEAVPRLIKLTNDPDNNVRLAAIQALGKIGGSEAKGWLQECLNSPIELIRRATEQALYELEVWEDPLSL